MTDDERLGPVFAAIEPLVLDGWRFSLVLATPNGVMYQATSDDIAIVPSEEGRIIMEEGPHPVMAAMASSLREFAMWVRDHPGAGDDALMLALRTYISPRRN
jgi:hypothetical protein